MFSETFLFSVRAVRECKLQCNSAISVQKPQEYSVRKSWINIIMQHVLLNYHDVHEKESKKRNGLGQVNIGI
jgi:hypothetical protein